MTQEPGRADHEDEFRTAVTRLVQTMHHWLPRVPASPQAASLSDAVGHLAGLLDAQASVEHTMEAAATVLDAYDLFSQENAEGTDGPDVDTTLLAAAERLREAMNAMDEP
jgi:hypothetical protein